MMEFKDGFSWIELYAQMKSYEVGYQPNIARVKLEVNGNEHRVREFTLLEVTENALQEALSLIPTLSEVREMQGEIFDRMSGNSKITKYLFDTERTLIEKKIKNV